MKKSEDKKLKRVKWIIIIISLLLFTVSLTQNAVTYEDLDGEKTHSSISLFFMGGLAILGGGLLEWLIWLSNPLFIIALIMFTRGNRFSIYLGAIATLLTSYFYTWDELLAAENGRTATIVSFDLGYILWIASIFVLTFGSIYYFRKK